MFSGRARGGAVASEPSLDSDVFKNAAYLGHSGKPSIGNVDLNEHSITFTVGIFVDKENGEHRLVNTYQSKTVQATYADFNFRLMKGQQYRIVAYANFGDDSQADLANIPIHPRLNDEISDAFFASELFTAGDKNIQVVLKRPFGKLRLIACHGSFKTFCNSQYEIDRITVTYGDQAIALNTNSFNAITGKFNEAEGTKSFTAPPAFYKGEEDTTFVTVFTMYLPVNAETETEVQEGDAGYETPVMPPENNEDYYDPNPQTQPQSWMYPFEIKVTYKDGKGTLKRSYAEDIPVKRNWLTTVDVCNFWTENSNITLTIDSRFQGEIEREPKIITVKTANELQEAIDRLCATAPSDKWSSGKIVLGADIDADENERIAAPGGFVFETKKALKIYLDLNGHTISANTGDMPRYKSEVYKGEINAQGVFRIGYWNNRLYINDSSKGTSGAIRYNGPAEKGYSLIYCAMGGQAIINGGSFISNSTGPVVYVYEDLQHQVDVRYQAYRTAKVTKNQKTAPTDEQQQKIESRSQQLSSSVTINSGWFENAQPSATVENEKVAINVYNITDKDWYKIYKKNGQTYYYWDMMNWLYGYNQEWASFGKNYVNCYFGYVFLNGGSYVEKNPIHDNIMESKGANEWVDDKHSIVKEIVKGKTVYTVVPNKSPKPYDPTATGHN